MNSSISRRKFLAQSADLAAESWMASPSWAAAADAFPPKPIRLVVGYPPGLTVDSAPRAVAVALASTFGKPVSVDSKAGANGIVAAQDVKQAAADRYTLLFGTLGQMTINPGIYKKLPYDPLKDSAPISLNGVRRRFLNRSRKLAVQRPYRSNRRQDRCNDGCRRINVATNHPKKSEGCWRNEQKQFSGLPAVKTIAEQGYPTFEVLSWTAAMAPTGTPPNVSAKLNQAVVNAQQHPIVVKAAQATSSDLEGETPEEVGKFLVFETRKWRQAAQNAGVE